MLTCLMFLAAGLSIVTLERARAGVIFTDRLIGDTPVTTLARPSADGPHVVMAHGFAGSREMMQGYGLTLAQAGYRVHMFDFQGHGAHPTPMSGDVTRIDGTTRLLMDQTRMVIDDVAHDTPIALIGHSMATDVLIRVAQETDTGPLVMLSAFSQAVTAEHPQDMLLIAGAWEPHLREFGLRSVQMLRADAREGEALETGGVIRAARVAPWAEHVAILHSRDGRLATLDWLNRAYGRDQLATAPPTGWAFVVLMATITMLSGTIARLTVPKRRLPPSTQPTAKSYLATLAVPAILTPFIAAQLDFSLLPVLVAEYLAIHLGLFGCLSLAMQRWLWGKFDLGWIGLGPFVLALAALLFWGLGVFGFALDRYGANFFPVAERVPIIAALLLGALPFMVADARLVWAASLRRRVAARVAVLASLGMAIALDVEGLFFLLIIAPVIILFFCVHGSMGRAFGHRAGPLLTGVALGLILAWALGVSFPMFALAGDSA